MEIRNATIADAKAIQWINKTSLGYDYPLEKTVQRITRLLEIEHPFFVACVDGKVIGYIHGEIYENTYCDTMINIMALSVDNDYKGQGAGRKLLETMEMWGRDHQYNMIRLNSGIEREKAHAFYEHCGYTHRKNQKNFVKSI